MPQVKDDPLVPEEVIRRQPPEAQEIIRLLLARLAAVQAEVVELKARLGKNPGNSSLPPSTIHPHAKPARPEPQTPRRKRGGQPGHQKHERLLVPPEQVTKTHVLTPDLCRKCGHQLSGIDPHPLRHQVFELPKVKPLVTEYQQHRLACPCCGTETTAPLPKGVPSGQAGPRLVAVVAVMMALFRQSKSRTALLLDKLFEVPASPGWIVKLQNQAADALRPCYEELEQALPSSTAVSMDETPYKEGRRKTWLWTAVTRMFTLFTIRDARSADVPQGLLGEGFAGVVTTDRCASYDWISIHQLCWAHLKRDFQALVDAGGKARPIGERLIHCTRQLFHHWHRFQKGEITRRGLKRRIEKEITWPVYEALEDGIHCGQADTAGTCQHIWERYDWLWRFLDYEGVEPTNNASERVLRHAVIWRKLSFGTQSARGSRFVETLLTVIETCRQQGKDLLDFVSTACQARLAAQPPPRLLPTE